MRIVTGFLSLIALLLAGPRAVWCDAPGAAQDLSRGVWTFEECLEGHAPAGFDSGRTGDGRPGRWVVLKDPGAPSGKQVLAQTDADDTDYRFPLAVTRKPILRDVDVSVRCKAVSGKVDQALGLVVRYRDPENYYITRANALEGNIRFYRIVKGKRQQIESWSGPVTGGVWHALRLVAQGDRFQVYWDGRLVLEAQDSTFTEAGKIGVWTKADSVTYFDDLSVRPVGP